MESKLNTNIHTYILRSLSKSSDYNMVERSWDLEPKDPGFIPSSGAFYVAYPTASNHLIEQLSTTFCVYEMGLKMLPCVLG